MSLPADGVNANTLAETTTIPTGKKLIFLDPDTNEGGIITLENLTKQILLNLTSQTFNLDQGNKTLLAALNELNSNLLKSENISDFDLKYTNENLRILYGLINGTAYISFDIYWIRIQFRSNLDNTFIRTVYGDSPIEEWTQIK